MKRNYHRAGIAVAIFASAVAFAQSVLTFVGTPPTAYDDGTPIVGTLTYNLYQGLCTNARPLGQVAGNVATPRIPRPVPTTPGEYCFYMTAVQGGAESVPSNEVRYTVAAPPPPVQRRPNPPTNLVRQ